MFLFVVMFHSTTHFSKQLISWYAIHKRDLPWRNIQDPYKIWLSEIILQQTQVIQGLSYYLKFTEKYPTVKQLANAPEDEVMRLWQGLGYYSRARNLHATAKMVMSLHNGCFPKTYEDIRSLKGIGDYTAAAIASFAYKLPHAVVDGNVYRVLSRVFGIDTPIDSTTGKKEFQELATQLLPKHQSDTYNQAIMEFGATWCKPTNPNCVECPFNTSCVAYNTNAIAQFPVKSKKTKTRNRFLTYFVFSYKDTLFIRKRTAKDIWQNLYEFFLIETDKETDISHLLTSSELAFINWETVEIGHISNVYKHVLSHQLLYAKFIQVKLKKTIPLKDGLLVKKQALQNYALPRLIDKYLEEIAV